MFSIEGNTISLTTGDTAIIELTLDNYKLVEGDSVVFTVKKNISDMRPLIEKTVYSFEDGKAKFMLFSGDTGLTPGKYIYDVQVNLSDGRIDTVIPPSTFKILKGVSY